jgi:Predicted S-adenosylmethionine-dependent methyltransferase
MLDNNEKLSNIWTQEPSILDIGFGSGETTVYLAKTKPKMLILGAEVYLSGIGSLLVRQMENHLIILNIKLRFVPFFEIKYRTLL